MQRRRLSLAVVAVLAIVVAAGCLGTGPTSGPTRESDSFVDSQSPGTPAPSPGEKQPSATRASAMSERCDGTETAPDFDLPDRLPSRADGFELRGSPGTVERGDSLSFALRNVDADRRYTGTRAQYLLQRRTADGWESVTLFRSGRSGFNATAVPHDPGNGFTWSIRASADGFSRGKYVVCKALAPGTYRFVYAGGPAVAVRFELRD